RSRRWGPGPATRTRSVAAEGAVPRRAPPAGRPRRPRRSGRRRPSLLCPPLLRSSTPAACALTRGARPSPCPRPSRPRAAPRDADLAFAVGNFDLGQLVGGEELGKLLDQRAVDAHRAFFRRAGRTLLFGHYVFP